MELYEKSLNTIELPAVLEMLAAEAVSSPAKEQARQLRPNADIYEVRRRLAETTAAKAMMVIKGSPSFSGVKDVRSSLSRADMGGMLNTRELLDIAGVLQSARIVRAYASGDDFGKSEILSLINSLMANRFLEEKITGSITGDDEIADAASAELAWIRRHMRAASARAREALQKIISSPSYARALQETIITQRDNRYVVPVKAEHKSAVPGLVHDVSASGATLFIEPMAAVKANNEIRELAAKEKQEIERILMELSADCAAHADDIIRDFNVLVRLDIVFAKAKLSFRLDCDEPELSEKKIKLRGARHPLLSKDTAVPIDVELGDGFDTLVITGPNTGGKTVTLKTLGILCVMAQCGLHIPAGSGSCVPVYEKVLADIGDEQSIVQSLSTFSSHMTNIVRILAECTDGTLLLFDELGAGTDPTEGAALAIAIIEYARKAGSMVAATTHYAELKVYATTEKGVRNASCEFDVETLRPTYRLLIGIPGKSNAFAIAERLGLSKKVIESARGHMSIESASLEDTIEKLEQTRQSLENDRAEARKLLREADESVKKSDRMRRELTVRLEKAEEKARRDAERVIGDARKTAEDVFEQLDALRRENAREESRQRTNEMKSELLRSLNDAEEAVSAQSHEPEEEKVSARPVKAGDTVEILSMGVKASVISVSDDRTLQLQAGVMKVTAREDEVYLLSDQPAPPPKHESVSTPGFRDTGARPELDIRGMTSDEATPVLERYIDDAVMSKLTSVTVIHGKGTGALRQAVHQSLKSHRLVGSFRLGLYGEGETGVTIVELK